MVGVGEEADELFIVELGVAEGVGFGEVVGDGDVEAVEAGAAEVVVLDAEDFCAGGVDEGGEARVFEGVPEAFIGFASGGGDGFVCVAGEAVAFFEEEEVFGDGGLWVGVGVGGVDGGCDGDGVLCGGGFVEGVGEGFGSEFGFGEAFL